MTEARLFKVEGQGHIFLRWDVAGNPDASKREGRPIFDKIIRCDIHAPNQGKSTPSCIVLRVLPDGSERRMAPHYERYAAQIQQFMSSEEGGDLQGTPVEKWPMIDAPMAASLKAMKVYTVEQLAESGETLSQRMMGGRELAKKAFNWLAAAKDGAKIGEMTEELAARDKKIEDLQRQLTELAQRFEASEKPARGKAA